MFIFTTLLLYALGCYYFGKTAKIVSKFKREEGFSGATYILIYGSTWPIEVLYIIFKDIRRIK